ncbi:phosphatase PAP2 family protein [Methanobacterium formicicum]|uniref:Phosphoesterase PA-phosphatase-like protein n=1 Tax=Methanobacterium formicicum (strain DSM 3637 / PP1) TaxID=1204725 RepID=K2R8Y1_METFP|nr:phosphatase PAP2 family protein [Methanobacterium formicicum]EKF84759.1 phosphoesterase PA-phosphatase-like protein [Methanobacterium formicicum DSM 3637]
MHDVLLAGILNQNVNLFYMINGGMDNIVFDFIMPLITNFGSIIAWVVICGLLFVFGGVKGKKVAVLGLVALFVSNAIVYSLKFIIAEPRPFLTLPNVDLLVYENGSYSFPSGHTASSFAAAVVIGLKYKFNFRGKSYGLIYPLLAFAGVVGFSRIYVGVHYPLDVAFGALIGILSALIVLKLENTALADKLPGVNS